MVEIDEAMHVYEVDELVSEGVRGRGMEGGSE
jgi:hypothetical protein